MKRIAIVLAGLLSACAPGGSVPAGNIPIANAAKSADPCASPPGYAFNGPCTTFELTQAGYTAKLPANNGYALSYELPANAIPKPITLALGDAVLTQIGKDPDGRAFPPYKGAGKTFLYALGYAARTTQEFATNGKIEFVIVSTNGFPGTACTFAALVNGKWSPVPEKVALSGNRLSFSTKLAGANIEKGKTYAAFACK